MPTVCAHCKVNRAVVIRPKNHDKVCKECFLAVFEAEIHQTITANRLFERGERIAIGASGGKDSTVLASVLKTLNERHDYGVRLLLLSIDEGIRGYRDDSLETVKRNAAQYDMPLTIVGYGELYGWTMDQVVEQVGKKGNCTYCGVFRRQALDRGAAMLGVEHVVTGHNADDMAETVLMNLLRGDIARLSRTTSIITSTPNAASALNNNNTSTNSNKSTRALSHIKRSKPLKYAYEKEIVLYAHHKQLDYFSTECIYSPEAFRGSARALIKDLERVRPTSILDIVHSGEDMARLCPGYEAPAAACGSHGRGGAGGTCSTAIASDAHTAVGDADEAADEAGCGSALGRSAGAEMQRLDALLATRDTTAQRGLDSRAAQEEEQQLAVDVGALRVDAAPRPAAPVPVKSARVAKQSAAVKSLGQCETCGYMSSQRVCKACVLLEGLNRSRPKVDIAAAVI